MNQVNMGFIGAGNISEKMAATISRMDCVRPYAVAARDADRAGAFAKRHGFARSYGSYPEMLEDPAVELVYVATPHSLHYEHVKMCLEHGKHVLCEKAFTANSVQAEEILSLAEGRKLLLTEAIWTRYMPFSRTIGDLLTSGIIGKVTALTANLGYDVKDIERMREPRLAGGALLDLSVYPLNFAFMCLGTGVDTITSTFIPSPSGVDAQNSITLAFANGAMAVLFSTMLNISDRQGVIYGSDGYMVVENINNPQSARLFDKDWRPGEVYRCPEQISGYEYEVESAVKAIGEGGIECPEMPHAETLRIMRMLDGIRAEWGMEFPDD